MQITILTPTTGPRAKLAQVELVFTEADGPLAGLTLSGFGIWRTPTGVSVTFPARPRFGETGRTYIDFLRGPRPARERLLTAILAAARAAGALDGAEGGVAAARSGEGEGAA